MQSCGEIAAYKGKNWMGLLNTFGMSLSVFSEIPRVTRPPVMAIAAHRARDLENIGQTD